MKKQQSPKDTSSELNYVPAIEDHAEELTCKVENPDLMDSAIEDSLVLEVHYKPVISIKAGLNMDLTDIKEGDDIFFECDVHARPAVDEVTWMHNGSILTHNVSSGLIVSNRTLVVQKVRRAQAGAYTCSAKNVEGISVSEKIMLQVKHAPLCARDTVVTQGVGLMESTELVCDVLARPSNLAFHWRLNSSSDNDEDLTSFVANGTRSVLTYNLRNQRAYGTILCFANNEIGRQRKACVFNIVPAGRPSTVSNCSQSNLSADSLSITCKPGYDGGLTQLFTLELYRRQDDLLPSPPNGLPRGDLVRNITASAAQFFIRHIGSGSNYAARIYATNRMGASPSIIIEASTLNRLSEKKLATMTKGGDNSKDTAVISDSVVHGGGDVGHHHGQPGLFSLGSWPMRTLMLVFVSALTIVLILVVTIGVICRIQCQMTTTAAASTPPAVTSSLEYLSSHANGNSGAEEPSGLVSNRGSATSSSLLIPHRGPAGPAGPQQDTLPQATDYLLPESFYERRRGEILPTPCVAEGQTKVVGGSEQDQLLHFQSAQQTTAASAAQQQQHSGVASPTEGGAVSILAGNFGSPRRGSLTNNGINDNLNSVCHSASSELLIDLPGSSKTALGAGPPPTDMASRSIGAASTFLGATSGNGRAQKDIQQQQQQQQANFMHTFPRVHHQPQQHHLPVHLDPSSAHQQHQHQAHLLPAEQQQSLLRSTRRKTVTFLGEVETIRCRGDSGGETPDDDTGLSLPSGQSTSTMLSPSSETEDYVESRV